MSSTAEQLKPAIEAQAQRLDQLREEVAKVIVGQRYMIDRILLALISDGHILLEGIPGLAKTTAVKTVAAAIDTGFSRIQFTPDLLPADLIGTEIFRPQQQDFVVNKGPVFTNLLLADEINRAPAKVQSALLEAMQERQVTIGGETHPLPEAQVDRFMLKLKVDYPNKQEEKEIMRRMARRHRPEVGTVLSPADIREMRDIADEIYIDGKVEDYIVEVVFASREPSVFGLDRLERLIDYGASPRASIYLAQAAKVQAFMAGRTYVTPQDIKTIGPDVLRHRILISYEAEAQDLDSDDLIQEIFNTVDVP